MLSIRTSMKRLATAALLMSLACLLISAAGAEAKLKAPGNLQVKKVSVGSVTVTWKDRSKGERSYSVDAESGSSGSARSLKAGAEKAKLKKLAPGTRYEISVKACAKKCGPAATAPAATLLAPYGGPHPALGCDVFPASDAFNEKVAGKPVSPRSNQIMNSLGGDLHPDFGSNPHYGIPYVVVPAQQPAVPIKFTAYGNQSDKGPYPIPPGAPVEGGNGSNGDRHVLVVKRPASTGGDCTLYELYRSFQKGRGYSGDSGSVFDLGMALIGQRPDGWTSADAAGLPIFPGLVTKEEVDSGVIDHAIRITFDETRKAYYPPATHYASDSCDASLPAMGERLRLKAGYDISQFERRRESRRDGAQAVRRDRRRQRLQLLHLGLGRPALERRQPEPAQGDPGLGLRGRQAGDRARHSLLTFAAGPEVPAVGPIQPILLK